MATTSTNTKRPSPPDTTIAKNKDRSHGPMKASGNGAGKAKSLAVFAILQTITALLFLYLFSVREPGMLLVAILFAMPPVFQVVGLLILADKSLVNFYSALSYFFTGSYFAGWLTYSFVLKPPSYASIICLAVSFALVLLASMTTGLIFYRDNGARHHSSWQSRIAASLGSSPAAEILLALSFFMSVAYVIAFSFALEDRHRMTHGDLPGLIRVSPLPGGSSRLYGKEDLTRKSWKVQFRLGSAALAIASSPNGTSPSESMDPLALENKATLDQLIEELRWNHQAVRVTLTGYASQIPISPRFRSQYGSNYELAEARIRTVQLYIAKTMVAEQDIEWLLVPVTEDAEARPRVEVALQPIEDVVAKGSAGAIRPLMLIEYLYFSVYTITTTGYGDIIPSSPLAMFICTLANWYEVFFLAIFFNVLLSAKRHPEQR